MSEFLKQLQLDIDNLRTINSNSSLFISRKKIKIYKFSSNLITPNQLPPQTTYGSCYLIKGNNIVSTYGWYDPAKSMYIQANIKKLKWVGKLRIINDDGKLSMLNIQNEQYTYKQSELKEYIIYLIRAGFLLYI